MPSYKPSEDAPLSVAVEKSKLVISIGINTLAFSAERCPLFFNQVSHVDKDRYCRVTDIEEFARDVVAELMREKEDGTTPVHVLLDDAFMKAYENGSIAIEDGDDA